MDMIMKEIMNDSKNIETIEMQINITESNINKIESELKQEFIKLGLLNENDNDKRRPFVGEFYEKYGSYDINSTINKFNHLKKILNEYKWNSTVQYLKKDYDILKCDINSYNEAKLFAMKNDEIILRHQLRDAKKLVLII